MGVVESYDDAKHVQTAISSVQNAIAELIQVGKTSRGYVGTLMLHPVQSIDKERVKVYSRIIVRLDFTESFPDGLRSSCFMRGDLPQKLQLAKTAKTSSLKSTNSESPLAHGEWYRIEVQEAGMYKLDYNYFHTLNIAINDIDSIKLYGNGGVAIPDNKTGPPDSLVEIHRLVVRKNNDGSPDPEDYVVFYGRGAQGWSYKGGNNFQHFINPYSEKNYYFFTLDQGIGKQIDPIVSSTGSPPTYQPASFQEKIFVEQERYNLMNSGRRWVGKLFTGTDNTDTYYNSLPGLVSSSQITYRFNFLRRSASVDILNIFENNLTLLGSIEIKATNVGYDAGDPYAEDVLKSATGEVPGNTSIIKIQVESNNQDSKTWLDWFEIFYQRRLEAIDDKLLFTTPDISGSIQYVVSKFSSSEILAFDITQHENVKQIKQLDIAQDNSCTFQFQQESGKVYEIAVVNKNGFKTPLIATKIENSNIRGIQDPVNFIIISPPEFFSEAYRLKAHRDSVTVQDRLNTLVVNINQIYNEFSSGLPDPLAIREFLQYTQENWDPVPAYILLFGWGHYDYKNISTSQRNWIPPYETPESFIPINSYPCDDNFIILGASKSYAMAIGRLPVRTSKEATVAVDKIISYETTASIDTWRNRITFVADDGKTSGQEDNGATFTTDSDTIAENKNYVPKSIEKKKIYIVAYPTMNTASGRRKPDANRAIVDAINQGTLITNFIGHGNERLWAHEAIFTREDDLPQLQNRDRLTFIVAATCSYGKYDNPQELSAAEQLVTMEKGGAVADLSAARLVTDPQNNTLIKLFYSNLLRRNTDGTFPRLGDAYLYAKKTCMQDGNSPKFHLFGDPTLRLLMPKNDAMIDSVNVNGSWTMATDSIKMKSLGRIQIAGAVKQKDGSTMVSFKGTCTVQLFDSQRFVIIDEGYGHFNFKVNGSMLYQGDVSITNGQFVTTIPIPKDVTFGKSARISMYAWNNNTDGVGYTENMMINGIDTTAVVDAVGPKISVYLNDTATFHAGDVVKSNPTLIVRLWDASGINISTIGVGHQLSATISNPERIYDLSNYYHSDLDTYQSGEVRYPLRDLSDGKYTLRVKAWDIQNNSSNAETFFEVFSTDDFALLHVLNYPNPFSSSTTFAFQRTATDPIDVEVKIYSIAGRLIQRIKMQSIKDPFVRIPWDGKDNDGSEIANGIYFYKLIARSQDGTQTNETIGKCAVMR